MFNTLNIVGETGSGKSLLLTKLNNFKNNSFIIYFNKDDFFEDHFKNSKINYIDWYDENIKNIVKGIVDLIIEKLENNKFEQNYLIIEEATILSKEDIQKLILLTRKMNVKLILISQEKIDLENINYILIDNINDIDKIIKNINDGNF